MAVIMKKNIPSSILWGIVAVLILLLGAGSAYFFYSKTEPFDPLASVKRVWDSFFAEEEAATAPSEQTSAPAGPRVPGTHVVREGENLWAIVRKGKLLDNPWQWKLIVDQNRDKVDSIVYSDNTGDWTVLIEPGQKLSVTPVNSIADKDAVPKKYALQVLSVPPAERQRGLDTVREILKRGHFAYLSRSKVKGEDFLRIRIGFFDNKPAAFGGARRLKRDLGVHLPNEPILVIPNGEELRGASLVYGIQRYRPWAVELKTSESHQEALRMLDKIRDKGEFAYIAQKRSAPSGVFGYAIRAGYFVSKKDAQAFLDNQGGDTWEGARPKALMHFNEALPGQRIVMRPSR